MQSALFIGRFQPFHNGHLDVIKKILKENDRVIIAIGSAEKNFLPSNPMTAGERFTLIDEALKEAKISEKKYCIIPIRNVNNFALWVNHVNTYVPEYTKLYTGSRIITACYENKYSKEHRANKSGPKLIQLDRNLLPVSGTEIREAILENEKWETLVPKAVAKKLKEWKIPQRLGSIRGSSELHRYNNSY